jgi:hypothetical protein
MRLARVLAIVCAAASAACLSSNSVIYVQPDGSGTVTNTILLKGENAQKKDGAAPASAKDIFSEAKMREIAPRMGEGVTFQSLKPLKQEGWEGATIIYAFKDVSKLKFNMRSETVDVGEAKPELLTFRFAPPAASGPATLTILMPEQALKKAMNQRASASDNAKADQTALGKAMLEQFKTMFEGMKASVAVEVAGPIVKTNADHVSGSTVTLLSIDFNELIKNTNDLETFAGMSDGSISLADAREKLKNVKGLVLTLQPEVNVAFAKK